MRGRPLEGAGIAVGNVWLTSVSVDDEFAESFGGLPGSGNNIVSGLAGVVDRGALNYYLTAESPAIGAGVRLAEVDGESLVPLRQYQHPMRGTNRSVREDGVDAGAFEYAY